MNDGLECLSYVPASCQSTCERVLVWLLMVALSAGLGMKVNSTVAAEKAPQAGAVPTELKEYVSRPEPVFQYRIRGQRDGEQGRILDVDLTSQQWQGIVWRHVLHIYEPLKMEHPKHVLLFVTGGDNGRRPGEDNIEMGMQLATMAAARVAMLFQVPNQPLFDDRREDDLITETWLRYLETGDATWPLLFPMVKSAVKAMDAIEEIAESRWDGSISGFVITGGSKRGWTSWLTPVADKRIVATAPIVIDVLNFQPQMQHQLDTWGEFSEQIADYTSKGLIKLENETPREVHLRQMMDPFTYRNMLDLPKLIINGTNDRYWVVDATRFYWRDLVGPKYLLQVPNAGHGLDGGKELALGTLAVFFRHVASGTPMPALQWKHQGDGDWLALTAKASPKPKAARLWVAHSNTKDLRESKWTPQPLPEKNGAFVGQVAKPNKGHLALFGELQFEFRGMPFSLSTLVRRE
jgi:PhoPQ-activated pathogenicity-related protein